LDGTQARTYLEKNTKVDVICAHESSIHNRYLQQVKDLGKLPGKDSYIACIDVGAGSLQDIKNV
jgi:hypothetical protein